MMARHDDHIRAKAIALRTEKHMTLDEIVACLSVPRTTVYGWIKDIPIPRTNRQSSAQQKGTAAMQAKFAALRQQAYDGGMAQAPELFADPLFRDFVVAYMCEGTKRHRNRVSFVNSNPAMIRLAHRWMVEFSDKPITYYIQYHVDQKRLFRISRGSSQ